MTNIRLFPLLTFLLCSASASAETVYKCQFDGKTAYSDRPCSEGQSIALPPLAVGVDLPGKNVPVTNDARVLLKTEKLRIANEKDVERARQARLKQEYQEQREAERGARLAATKRKQCDRLRLRHKWATEDAARARGAEQQAAQRKAQRQAESLAVECPA
jgi:phage protein D